MQDNVYKAGFKGMYKEWVVEFFKKRKKNSKFNIQYSKLQFKNQKLSLFVVIPAQAGIQATILPTNLAT